MSAEYTSICDWLNGHTHGQMTDFEAGIMIIEAYTPEHAPRMRMLRSDSRLWNFFEARLAELDKLAKATPQPTVDLSPFVGEYSLAEAKEVAAKIAATIPEPQRSQSVISPKNQSAQIRELEQEVNLLLKNQGYLHTQLRMIGRDRLGHAIHLSAADRIKRQQLRDQLVDAEAQIREKWLAIQHVQIHGCLPNAPAEKKEVKRTAVPVDFKEVESNRKMISYLKGKIAAKKKELSGLTGQQLLKAHKALEKMENNLAEREKQKAAWQAVN